MVANYTIDFSQPNRRLGNSSGGRTFGDHVGALAMGAVDGVTLNWADEALGLVNQDWRDEWRRNQEEARANHGGLYFGGQIASAFAPGAIIARGAAGLGRGMGLAQRLARGTAGHNALGFASGVGSGVLYGAGARAGDAEDGERWAAAANPVGLAGDAAFGGLLGSLGTFVGANVVGRAAENAINARNARTTFNQARDAAVNTARTAQQRAQAIAPLEWIDSTRRAGARNLEADVVGQVTGEAAALQDRLRDVGIDSLTRSQLLGDRLDQMNFWKAYEGMFGDRAKDRALAIVDQQRQQIRQGFGRVMDTPAGRMTPDQMPASATQGAQRVLDGLQSRSQEELADIKATWDRLTPQERNARLRFSNRGGPSIRDLVSRVDDLTQSSLFRDSENRLVWESADDIIRRQGLRTFEHSAPLYRDIARWADRGRSKAPGDAGTLDTLLRWREAASNAVAAARQAGNSRDEAAASMLFRSIDDFIASEAPLTQLGASGAVTAREAIEKGRRYHETFTNNRTISRGVDDEVFQDDPRRWLSLLIGQRGVQPGAGAVPTLQRIKDRFGETSDVWQNTRAAVLSRFTDQIEDAVSRGMSGDPLVMTAIQGSIRRLFRDDPAFMDLLFSPAEQERLLLLAQAAMRTQSPGRGALGPSSLAVSEALNMIPGVEVGRRVFETIRGPGIVRREMQAIEPPGMLTAIGNATTNPASYIFGPQSIAGDIGVQSVGAAATNAALISQANDQRIRERERQERIERIRAMMTGESPQGTPAASTEEDELLRLIEQIRQERARRSAQEAQQQGQPQ